MQIIMCAVVFVLAAIQAMLGGASVASEDMSGIQRLSGAAIFGGSAVSLVLYAFSIAPWS